MRDRRDTGSASIELVILFPALLLLVTAMIQYALWFHARSLALAAAQEGVAVARAYGSTPQAGRDTALAFVRDHGARHPHRRHRDRLHTRTRTRAGRRDRTLAVGASPARRGSRSTSPPTAPSNASPRRSTMNHQHSARPEHGSISVELAILDPRADPAPRRPRARRPSPDHRQRDRASSPRPPPGTPPSPGPRTALARPPTPRPLASSASTACVATAVAVDTSGFSARIGQDGVVTAHGHLHREHRRPRGPRPARRTHDDRASDLAHSTGTEPDDDAHSPPARRNRTANTTPARSPCSSRSACSGSSCCSASSPTAARNCARPNAPTPPRPKRLAPAGRPSTSPHADRRHPAHASTEASPSPPRPRYLRQAGHDGTVTVSDDRTRLVVTVTRPGPDRVPQPHRHHRHLTVTGHAEASLVTASPEVAHDHDLTPTHRGPSPARAGRAAAPRPVPRRRTDRVDRAAPDLPAATASTRPQTPGTH